VDDGTQIWVKCIEAPDHHTAHLTCWVTLMYARGMYRGTEHLCPMENCVGVVACDTMPDLGDLVALIEGTLAQEGLTLAEYVYRDDESYAPDLDDNANADAAYEDTAYEDAAYPESPERPDPERSPRKRRRGSGSEASDTDEVPSDHNDDDDDGNASEYDDILSASDRDSDRDYEEISSGGEETPPGSPG
jgi:hypothetical protein